MEAKKPEFISDKECSALANLMEKKYASFLAQRSFATEITKDARGVYAKVTLKNSSGSYFYPVEGRIAHLDHDMSARDAGLFLLDYIDAYFEEYFREGDVYLPIDWSNYEHEGVPLQLRGQILNLEAERLADELLRGNGGAELH